MEKENLQEKGSSIPTRDINGKHIFGNHVMCAQFLRNDSGCPLLKNVQPEDIEDVTERFLPYAGAEYFGDTVKKIRLHDSSEAEVLYLISLIEHKSQVDYNVIMQLLRYMVGIWHAYEKSMKEEKVNITAKSFRYPPILPIVYYEGTGKWTADMHLKDRILLSELFTEFIPDFTYKLVRIHNYSNDELLSREDAMSLLMIINKIQTADDWKEFELLPKDKLARIIKNSPQAVLDVLTSVIFSLCKKVNLPENETRQYIEQITEGHNMGYLFENMEKMDIQAERRNTAEARKALQEAREEILRIQKRAEKAEANLLQTAVQSTLQTCQDFNATMETALEKITQKFNLTNEQAEEAIAQYWGK